MSWTRKPGKSWFFGRPSPPTCKDFGILIKWPWQDPKRPQAIPKNITVKFCKDICDETLHGDKIFWNLLVRFGSQQMARAHTHNKIDRFKLNAVNTHRGRAGFRIVFVMSCQIQLHKFNAAHMQRTMRYILKMTLSCVRVCAPKHINIYREKILHEHTVFRLPFQPIKRETLQKNIQNAFSYVHIINVFVFTIV